MRGEGRGGGLIGPAWRGTWSVGVEGGPGSAETIRRESVDLPVRRRSVTVVDAIGVCRQSDRQRGRAPSVRRGGVCVSEKKGGVRSQQ